MPGEVESLLNEVRLTFHLATQVAESLHASEGVTAAQRGVLEFLETHGPSTVPEIARARFVTRQHIQVLANGLLDAEFVESRENPSHRRSSLLALTQAGTGTITRMKKRERVWLAGFDVGIADTEIKRATRALGQLREAMAHAATGGSK